MIAIDSSSLRRFLEGSPGRDVDLVREAIAHGRAALPSVVLTEILSDPSLTPELVEDLSSLPLLEIADGYWRRSGLLRASLLKSGYKAKLADVLIAQSCIDNQVPIVTYDRDFRHFTRSGLSVL